LISATNELALCRFACFSASIQNQSTGVQTYTPLQPLQPGTAGPVVLRTQPRFSWYRAFLAAGLLLGFGASAAVFVKVFLIAAQTTLNVSNFLAD